MNNRHNQTSPWPMRPAISRTRLVGVVVAIALAIGTAPPTLGSNQDAPTPNPSPEDGGGGFESDALVEKVASLVRRFGNCLGERLPDSRQPMPHIGRHLRVDGR